MPSHQDVIERKKFIIDLIKDAGKKGLLSSDVARICDISPWNRSAMMKDIMRDNPEVKRIGASNSTRYIWEEDVSRYENTNRNAEGYVDMTATTAIRNVENEQDMICPLPGEIWNAEEASGQTSFIYVLAFEDGAAQCVKLFDVADTINADSIKYAFRVKLGSITYIGDCSRVTFKLKKYLIRRSRDCDDKELMNIRKLVADALCIQAFKIERVEVPGPERIIYKTRDEIKIPEGYISKDSAKITDLENQVTIWRTVALKLMDNKKE